MLGLFKKKVTYKNIIEKNIPFYECIREVLLFKNYYASDLNLVRNDVFSGKSDNEICLIIMSHLLKEDECESIRCGHGFNPEFGECRFPILIFNDYIFVGINVHNELLHCILKPTGKESIGRLQIKCIVESLRDKDKKSEVENMLFHDADMIIRKLYELKHNQ